MEFEPILCSQVAAIMGVELHRNRLKNIYLIDYFSLARNLDQSNFPMLFSFLIFRSYSVFFACFNGLS